MIETTPRQPLPLLALRDCVLFPGEVQTVIVGRRESQSAVDTALASDPKELFVVAQREPHFEHPRTGDELAEIGVVAEIKKAVPMDGRVMRLVVEGGERVVWRELSRDRAHFVATVEPAPLDGGEIVESSETDALVLEVRDQMRRLLSISGNSLPEEVLGYLSSSSDPRKMCFFYSSVLHVDSRQQQELLAAKGFQEALRMLYETLGHEVTVFELRSEISSQARQRMTQEHREHLLRQELKSIREELGDSPDGPTGIVRLRERVAAAKLPDEARAEAVREIDRLERMPSASPETGTLREHLEFLLALPWKSERTRDIDVAAARAILDEDHFGLSEVKTRVLEFLAVRKLNPDAPAPILCLVGPPGVGKTSIGRSIARAMGREFDRISLGGLHDESELRGHRRTYVGAMPGRVLQSVRRAGVSDPVLLLDEIDKLGRDFRGDPSAALLEILDAEQNSTFHDHYLGVPFDLSNVVFVATANSLEGIPAPLRDRMDVVRFSGYSGTEKREIARRYLWPRKVDEAGIDATRCSIEDEAIDEVVRGYTREAGVRELHRRLGEVTRKIALEFAEGAKDGVTVTKARAEDLLGPAKFVDEARRENLPTGVARGLAWTPVGGELLYIETSCLPHGDGMAMTGKLGEVMRESGTTARSFVWAHAERLGIDPRVFQSGGVHLHVPHGAIPKDGPSAGVTIATALVSLLTGRAIRPDVAMTGEVTLTGLVLPVGGIKEKLLAAKRAGVERVALPGQNRRDVGVLDASVTDGLEILFVETMDELLAEVLEGETTPQTSPTDLRVAG